MTTGAAKSPWAQALLAAGSIAVVSAFAVVRGWSFDSWVWAATVCAISGVVWFVAQVVRNRRIDRVIERARAMNGKPEFEHGPAVDRPNR